MPTAEQIHNVYDFEGVFSEAFQQSLKTITDELELATRSIKDAPQLQSQRPRIDVGVMISGSGKELYPKRGEEGNPGACLQTTFTGQANFEVITPAVETLHSQIRARVRFHCALMKRHVNGTLLTRHKLNWMKAGGCAYAYDADKAFYKTTLIFEFGFSLQADALAELEE